MCFIEVDDHLAVLRHIGIEKPAGRVSFFAGRLVSKSEKQLVVFDRRLEPPGLASEFEFREPWSGIFLGHAQDIGDRNLMDWIIRMPLCANPELLVDGRHPKNTPAGGSFVGPTILNNVKPEMSAAGIADAVTNAIRKGDFDAIIMNFANADMVGHSGNLEATIKAVETVDACLGQIRQALNDAGDTAWLITADHGNAETMIDPKTGGPHTYHTTNPVPFVLVSNDANTHVRPDGSLQDISPTILGALGIEEPIEMTGRDLRTTQS